MEVILLFDGVKTREVVFGLSTLRLHLSVAWVKAYFLENWRIFEFQCPGANRLSGIRDYQI